MEQEFLAEQFEANRSRLKAVAYRMLSSLAESEDAVQEAWIRASRADLSAVDNLDAWLTTVVARLCLDTLRFRKSRAEDSFDARIPDPIVTNLHESDPEQQALLSDSLGLAMIVVLDTLAPAERIAFVLHDTFSMPFDEIASILDRTPEATRQLASRARRRVQETVHVPNVDLPRQHKAVDAFLTATRKGDLNALLAVLDPNVTLRVDMGTDDRSKAALGAEIVANQTLLFAQATQFAASAQFAVPILVNGAAGALIAPNGKPFSVMAFTVTDEKIIEINVVTNVERLAQLDLEALASD
jgi:RNA polymerase sigma-70 factor (ECF subfamily)